MSKILCPVDFSNTSLNAIEFAVEIGKKFQSHITLFHVFTEKDFNKVVGSEFVGKSFKELLAMATNKLKRLAEEINENPHGRLKCSYLLELGNFIDKVEEETANNNYDLVVIGTTGISRVNGVFFGSNTEGVIDSVKVPILCIPQQSTYSGFRKIVYASDFAREDHIAIQEVISFATMFDARINVLHINLKDDDREYKHFVEDLKSFIQYKKIGFMNKRFKENVGLGIEEYLQEGESDLLVVLKRPRSFVQSIFNKSLTKVLSYSSDKPLFVLKLESY